MEAVDVYYRNVTVEILHYMLDLDIWFCQVPLKYLKQIPKIKKIIRPQSGPFIAVFYETLTRLAKHHLSTSTRALSETHGVQVSTQLSIEYQNRDTGQR